MSYKSFRTIVSEFRKTIEGREPKPATTDVVTAIYHLPGVRNGLSHIARECLITARNAAKDEDASYVIWKASEIFNEKAQDFLLEHMRKYNFPEGLNSLAGSYKGADYEQIFAFLTTRPEIASTLKGEEKAFAHFRSVVGKREDNGPTDNNGWSNYATWLVNLHLDNESEVVYRAANDSIRAQAKECRNLRKFVAACAQSLGYMTRNLAMKNIRNRNEEPSELFGWFKDANYPELAISRIEDMGIREVRVTGFELENHPGEKLSFFILPDEDPADVVRERMGCPDLRAKKDGDTIRLLDKENWELFTIDSVAPLKLHMLKIEYPDDVGLKPKIEVYRDGDDPIEYMKSRYTDWKSVIVAENGSVTMLDENNKALRTLSRISLENESPAPAMGM